MRGIWLIVVGISVLGCKGNESKPAPAASGSGSATPTPTASTPSAPTSAPPAPKLDLEAEFSAEKEDKVWADATEKSLAAIVPELAEVTCLERQCRGLVKAASQEELVKKVDAIQDDEELRAIAKNVVLSGDPSKNEVKIYVRFDR